MSRYSFFCGIGTFLIGELCQLISTLLTAATSKPKRSSYMGYDLPSSVLRTTTIQRTVVLKEGFAIVAG
jgi:hypothetical protein